mgnify:CR=1 FL=1
MASTYILIDTTLIGHQKNNYWIRKNNNSKWLRTIYDKRAISVTPILIDVERAYSSNKISIVMDLVNSMFPQLGISFIDTNLTLQELQRHLQKFIYVKTEDHRELTLRFSDCLVISELANFLKEEQWASIITPFESWKIHGKTGKLLDLPMSRLRSPSVTPLILSKAQISAVKNSMGAYQLLMNIDNAWPNFLKSFSKLLAYEYASKARDIWLSTGHLENVQLVLFTLFVFKTQGWLLNHPALNKILNQRDEELICGELEEIIKDYLSKVLL